MLTLPDRVHFAGLAAGVAGAVSLDLHDDDGMFHGDALHYLTCGASALNAIAAAVERAGTAPRRILDFGAGAGRVTRWMRAAWPDAAITVTDIRATDLAFCERAFGTASFASGIVVGELHAPALYDLVWVGSVVTHLSEAVSEDLLRKLASWLAPDGVLVASFHGRFVAARAPSFGYYGVPDGWDALLADLARRGFGYADYPAQQGYGISVCTTAWMAAMAERIAGSRLVLLSERAWDGHHDVVAMQNRRIGQGLPPP